MAAGCVPERLDILRNVSQSGYVEEAGVEVPTNDWTVDDYKEIAAELTQKNGDRTTVYGTAINNYRADWINWMGNYEADWFAMVNPICQVRKHWKALV